MTALRLQWKDYDWPLFDYEVRPTVVIATILVDGKRITIANARDHVHKVISMDGRVVDNITKVRH